MTICNGVALKSYLVILIRLYNAFNQIFELDRHHLTQNDFFHKLKLIAFIQSKKLTCYKKLDDFVARRMRRLRRTDGQKDRQTLLDSKVFITDL